jgi:prephenate dehydratase
MNEKVAYLGPAGTFSHEALLTLLPYVDDPLPLPTVTRALAAVRAEEVHLALVPIENSVEGAVSATLDELSADGGLNIVAEIAIPVEFCLAARPGITDVRTVVTHPHAEAQCRAWLASQYPEAAVVPASSTAAAAAAVARGEFDAAICAQIAAKEYGLAELAIQIADNPDAQTRFILVGPAGRVPARTGADKTTLELFMRADHPGALLEILTEFAVRGVNLTRIESRPTKTSLGSYYFSVDCEGHIQDARVAEALMGLHRICADVRFLGSYPRHDNRSPVMREGTRNEDFAGAQKWFDALLNPREGNS